MLSSKDLSASALRAIKDSLQGGEALYLPSISLVEIIYLTEKGRLPGSALERVSTALNSPDVGLKLAALDRSVAESVPRISRGLVPDMPDRIIAATALSLGLPLITRDSRIRAAGIQTIW
jgi:predicted nucleic acid-binding protein